MTPYEYGRAAFERGIRCAPAMDAEFLATRAGLPISSHRDGAYDEWLRGWTDANLAAPTPPTVTKALDKRIVYNPQDRDYASWVIFEDGHEECIGDRKTFHDASLLASDYIIGYYNDNHAPEKAAELIMEELAIEGRLAQAAADMGGEWEISGDWVDLSAPDTSAPATVEGERPCWCATWHSHGRAGNCPACQWRKHLEDASISPPMCTAGGCTCTRPATREGLTPGFPVCDECDQAGMARLKRAIFGDPDPQNDVCWSCGDQLDSPTHGPALCGACQDAGQQWPEISPVLNAALAPTEPPPPTEAGLDEIAAGLSCDEAVRVAIATSHIPLLDEERWRHKSAPISDEEAIRIGALALLQTGITACTACGGRHHPTQCPQIGAAMLQPFCDGQAGPCGKFGRHAVLAYMGSSDGRPLWETLHFCDTHLAQWEANAMNCPSCNDPVRTPRALCPACQESGEGRQKGLALLTLANL